MCVCVCLVRVGVLVCVPRCAFVYSLAGVLALLFLLCMHLFLHTFLLLAACWRPCKFMFFLCSFALSDESEIQAIDLCHWTYKA